MTETRLTKQAFSNYVMEAFVSVSVCIVNMLVAKSHYFSEEGDKNFIC